MMKPKIKPVYLLFASLIMLVCVLLLPVFSEKVRTENYDVYLRSSRRMQKALDAVREYCIDKGIALESEDANGTYLLGPEITELTSTVGNGEIKRTTVNPDNAAVMAKYLLEAGVEPGDAIGVGTSGSFPAYAIATVCAATELGLRTRVIASYGSSMFGATRPELNIVTILRIIKDSGIADFDLVAVSPGGSHDSGIGAFDDVVFENTRDLVLELADESNAIVIDQPDMVLNIEQRLELLGDISCFVNIGGAVANSGSEYEYYEMNPGVIRYVDTLPKSESRGLVFRYLERGIPIINILNVRKIASDNGLPIDPSPMPVAGDGGIYYETSYPVLLIAIAVLLSLSVCYLGTVNQKNKKVDINN